LIPYTSGTTNVGSLNVGNATAHTDTGVIAGFTASEPLYLYTSLQNTSASNTSYASYAVNDGGHTAYGELGINNANYSYSAAGYPNNGFSTPLASFVESFGGPLVLGSWDSQKISFIVNGASNTSDAMTVETSGAVTIPSIAATGGTINGTPIGGTTPSTGTFTTLTATGQTSLGGASGSESLRVLTPISAAGLRLQVGVPSSTVVRLGPAGTSVADFRILAPSFINFFTGSSSDGLSDGNAQMRVSHTASAVNYVQVTGAATTASPVISAQGSDSNPGLIYQTKGFGSHLFRGYGGSNIFANIYAINASPVNYLQFGANTSGNAPAIQSQGTDADIDLTLTPKGTGAVRFGTYTGTILTPTGYITIKDSGGTSRRLLVG
jgi:hypothetical protein